MSEDELGYIKTCATCKWCRIKIVKEKWEFKIFGVTISVNKPEVVSDPTCMHQKSNNLYRKECNPVTGKSYHTSFSSTDEHLHCDVMRGGMMHGIQRNVCGRNGTLWETKSITWERENA